MANTALPESEEVIYLAKAEEPGRRKRLPAPERKRIIMEAATRTFVELGYQKALMDTIAQRSGVTKPIIYRHFSSKLDLLLSILQAHAAELTRMVNRPLQEYHDWQEAVERSIRAFFDFVERYEMSYRLTFEGEIAQEPEVISHIQGIRRSIMESVAKEQSGQGTDPSRFEQEEAGNALGHHRGDGGDHHHELAEEPGQVPARLRGRAHLVGQADTGGAAAPQAAARRDKD